MDGFGEKSFSNLAGSIEKARKTSLYRLIYALGIPNVGLANAKVICRQFGNDLEKIRRLTLDELAQVDGIGPVIAGSFVEYFSGEERQKKLDHLLSHLEIEQETEEITQELAGLQFVITGSLEHFDNRSQLKAAIEARGGKVTGSVTSRTSYLINNDTASSSSKNRKARELGVPVLSEEEVLKMLQGQR